MAENERILTVAEIASVNSQVDGYPYGEEDVGDLSVLLPLLAAQDAKTLRALERAGLRTLLDWVAAYGTEDIEAPAPLYEAMVQAAKALDALVAEAGAKEGS